VMFVRHCATGTVLLLLGVLPACVSKRSSGSSRPGERALTAANKPNRPPMAGGTINSAPANESSPAFFERRGLAHFEEPDLSAIADHLELAGFDGWRLSLAVLGKLKDHGDTSGMMKASTQLSAVFEEQALLMARLEKLRGVSPLDRIAPVTALLEDVKTFNAHVRWLYLQCETLLDSYQPAKSPPEKPASVQK